MVGFGIHLVWSHSLIVCQTKRAPRRVPLVFPKTKAMCKHKLMTAYLGDIIGKFLSLISALIAAVDSFIVLLSSLSCRSISAATV